MSDAVDVVRKHLTEIVDLAAQLDVMPGSRTNDDPEMRFATPSPKRAPLNLGHLDLADPRMKDCEPGEVPDHERVGVLPYLQMWQMLVFAELIDIGGSPDRCCPDSAEHTIAGEVAWLVTHINQIFDMHDDFPDSVRRMRNRLRTELRIRDQWQPRCPQCEWPAVPEDDGSWFRCSGNCGKTWVMGAELERLGALQPNMPLSEIAHLLGRSLATLRDLKIRGKILPVDRKGKEFLYDLERVRRVVEETKTRTRRSSA